MAYNQLELLEKVRTNSLNQIDFTTEIIWDYQQTGSKFNSNKHTGAIKALVQLPSGMVASASADKTINIWDVKTLQPVKTLLGHTGTVNALVVLPGNILASGGDDNTIRFWRGESFECIKILSELVESVSALAALPNGTLVIGAGDSTIHLYDTKAEKITKTLRGHSGHIYGLAVKADGTLISCSQDKTIRFWDTQNYRCIKTLSGVVDASVSAGVIALHSDGVLISGGNDNIIRLWDTNTFQCRHEFKEHTDNILALAKLENGVFVSSAGDGTLRCWNMSSAGSLATMNFAASTLLGLPDGCWLSGNKVGQLRLWQTPTRALRFAEIESVLKSLSVNVSVKNLNLANIVLADQGAQQLLMLLTQRPDMRVTGVSIERISDRVILERLQAQIAYNNAPVKAPVAQPKVLPQRPIVPPPPKAAPQALPVVLLEPIRPNIPKAAALQVQPAVPKVAYKPTPKNLVDNLGKIQISIDIAADTLETREQLGEGSFATVYKGLWNRFTQVAIKKLKAGDLPARALEEFKHEVSLMAQLRSPRIVELYGACFENSNYALVVEYMSKGNLTSVLKSAQPLNWIVRYQIAVDVADGIAFLHSKNIIHADLKSLNILLDDQYRAKISDFGISKLRSDANNQTVMGPHSGGSALWMAPEILLGNKTTKQSDVFSFAMILWELGSLRSPYEGKVSNIQQLVQYVTSDKREQITVDTPVKMKSVIERCWFSNPANRLSMEQATTILHEEQELHYKRP